MKIELDKPTAAQIKQMQDKVMSKVGVKPTKSAALRILVENNKKYYFSRGGRIVKVE